MLNVVESVARINHHEAAVYFEAFDENFIAVLFREARNAVHDGKNRMRHGNLLQRVFRKTGFDFLAKSFVPFFIGTTGAREQETALSEIFSQLLALLLCERKGFVAGHDAEGEIKERVGIEADGAEGRVDAQIRLFGDVVEKIVRKTNGAFVAGVYQVAALEKGEIGVDGWGGGGLLRENRAG